MKPRDVSNGAFTMFLLCVVLQIIGVLLILYVYKRKELTKTTEDHRMKECLVWGMRLVSFPIVGEIIFVLLSSFAHK
jgi:hypothetical protein